MEVCKTALDSPYKITSLSGIELRLSEGSHLNTWVCNNNNNNHLRMTPPSLVDVNIADSDVAQGRFVPKGQCMKYQTTRRHRLRGDCLYITTKKSFDHVLLMSHLFSWLCAICSRQEVTHSVSRKWRTPYQWRHWPLKQTQPTSNSGLQE